MKISVKTIITYLMVMFAFISIVGIASAQTPSFEVESFSSIDRDTVMVRTPNSELSSVVTLLKDGKTVQVVKTWTIFICPKVGITKESIRQINCFRLEDGSIVSVPRRNQYIDTASVRQLQNLVKARLKQ
jgi:hypothetical protein